jgi:hypothetical protein
VSSWSRGHRSWRCSCIVALNLVIFAQAGRGGPGFDAPSRDSAIGPRGCLWQEVTGERLLGRKLDDLSVTNATVLEAWASVTAHGVPLSFIEGESETRLSLNLSRITVREALDAIVAHAPGYRYALISGRLVLYPRDPRWETRLGDVRLGPGRRLQVAKDLLDLVRRTPTLSAIGYPVMIGDPRSFVYQDKVSVVGTGSVLELLVQLLGDRPSAIFLLGDATGGMHQFLLSGVVLLRSLRLLMPSTTLRHGDAVQLKVLGSLYDGSPKDLTAGACLTTYWVSDERILTVSPDGLVRAHGTGEARVKASNENVWDSVTIHVVE